MDYTFKGNRNVASNEMLCKGAVKNGLDKSVPIIVITAELC